MTRLIVAAPLPANVGHTVIAECYTGKAVRDCQRCISSGNIRDGIPGCTRPTAASN